MKQKIYNRFVNRHSGISFRYHKFHDGSKGVVKFLSWVYLLWLNFAYYILQFHSLGRIPEFEIYESKRLNIRMSESEEYLQKKSRLRVEGYIESISAYDVISFDIFDTLIFRPFSLPTDVFYLIGNELDIMDFKNIRAWAEWDSRVKRKVRAGDMEISLADIWMNLQGDIGGRLEVGPVIEAETEQRLCYANPFMLEVWKRLSAAGKRLIIVSDMYLPENIIIQILEKNGFTGAEKIYISNVYHKSKADGTLFQEVIHDVYGVDMNEKRKSGNNILTAHGTVNQNPNGWSIVHIGDNLHSDVNMAKACGLDVMPYQNVNQNMLLYRAFDMSPLVGSAYRAIVSNWLYSGLRTYSMEYEYGFIYGGLFVLGYCSFIHDYCMQNDIDKVLFLSRDGDILKQAYDALYPEAPTEYVYWSRKAAAKLEAVFDKHDYFSRFIYQKMNQGYSIQEILDVMDLSSLVEELDDWKHIWITRTEQEEIFLEEVHLKKRKQHNMMKHFVDLKAEDELTDKNGYILRQFIEAKWDKVAEEYSGQNVAAKKYYESVLSGCRKVAVVDIGWAGSGAMTLRHLVSQEWNISCEIIGIIAGTNTIHNAEPDVSEGFLQSGKLISYLYSSSHNRELLKKHNPGKKYNVFWELLLSSQTPQFNGFYCGKWSCAAADIPNDSIKKVVYLQDLDITLVFGRHDANQKGIGEIQCGILDFVHEYQVRFQEYPYMFHISGRDAYAPMLIAASHNEKYLKTIEKKFALEINVN